MKVSTPRLCLVLAILLAVIGVCVKSHYDPSYKDLCAWAMRFSIAGLGILLLSGFSIRVPKV